MTEFLKLKNIIGFIAAICLCFSLSLIKSSAVELDLADYDTDTALADAITIARDGSSNTPIVITSSDSSINRNVSIDLANVRNLTWAANTPLVNLTLDYVNNTQYYDRTVSFSNAALQSLTMGNQIHTYETPGSLVIDCASGNAVTLGEQLEFYIDENISITARDGNAIYSGTSQGCGIRFVGQPSVFNATGLLVDGNGSNVFLYNGVYIDETRISPDIRIDVINTPDNPPDDNEDIDDPPEPDIPEVPEAPQQSSSVSPTPTPQEPVIIELPISAIAGANTVEGYAPPKIIIADETPFVKNGEQYYGTVEIESVNSDKPQAIPTEVLIDGERYAVGDTVIIVGAEDKTVEAVADTGFFYVFSAVENSEEPVKFTAEGLPEGLEISEDGIITTTILPAPVGTFSIKVTADNGLDTHTYEMTIEIKEGGLTDAALLAALTANDVPELAPSILALPGDITDPESDEETVPLTEPGTADGTGDDGDSETVPSVPNLWINGDVKLHYTPETEDFFGLFLDGKLLIKDEDYFVEEGSTIIILSEKTVVPLKNGDHVVTTLFTQDSDVGMDTVINDVGSSSFVFRLGDKDADGKRINIGGDGVIGSVTFEETGKDEPLTTISTNTATIEERAAKLSNATGNEIIAAFETRQQGGFGGKTATFAISAASLNLSLPNGSAVYVAVYDSVSKKTYQNKGEIKNGMIVFKTKYSGVFMISKEKY
jgi:hypothetical protein